VTWWKWGLAALVVAGLLAASGFAAGVSKQRADDTKARLAIIAAASERDRVHAATIAALEKDVARETAATEAATARAVIAERRAQSVMRDVSDTRDALTAAQTAADSLAAYPPVVDALTRQLVAVDSARLGYRDALAASVAASGLLRQRIAADSVLIRQQATTLAMMIPVAKVTSRWACVAGVGVTTGLRTGAGLGITCGRRF
jgi:hypothetical protein